MVATLVLKGLFKVLRCMIIIHLSWSHVRCSAAHLFKSLDSTGRDKSDMFRSAAFG